MRRTVENIAMINGDTPVSPEVLSRLLDADFAAGKLFWRERGIEFFSDRGLASPEVQMARWNGRCAGKETGKIRHDRGYLLIRVFRRNYFAHRVIWAMHTGKWPAHQIDHINHVRDDNRVWNLRAVSSRDNSLNQSVPSTNTSGVVGVAFDESRQKWTARIKVKGRAVHLGRFNEIEDAIRARKVAEAEHGFHPNHGQAY